MKNKIYITDSMIIIFSKSISNLRLMMTLYQNVGVQKMGHLQEKMPKFLLGQLQEKPFALARMLVLASGSN
jgi:hypothetical protein